MREKLQVRGLALIGVLNSLAEGEEHYLYCEGSCKGHAVNLAHQGLLNYKHLPILAVGIFGIFSIISKSQQSFKIM